MLEERSRSGGALRPPVGRVAGSVTRETLMACSLVLLASGFSQSAETVDVRLGGHGSGGGQRPGTSSDSPAGGLAFPDAASLSADALLAGEGRNVLGALGDFEFLDDLSEGSTVPGAELADDAYLLCSLCHYVF